MTKRPLNARRTRTLTRGGAAAILAVAALSACSSSSPSSKPAGSGITFNAQGIPDLKGQTVTFAVPAAPDPSDTKLYLMAQILQSWGANASLINQADDPGAIRVVLAGDANVGADSVSAVIDSGLMVFGPAQPRLDYHFIGAPSLSSLSELPGKIYGTSNQHGLEALMFADLLAKNHIAPSSVSVTVAGGSSVRVSAMLAGHIQATFVHQQDVAKLTSAGFHDLGQMSTIAPELADSLLAASKSWYSAHPDLAVAIDEAWIKAAQIFDTNEGEWVKAAVAYGKGTTPDAQALYTALKAAETFPAAKDAFTASSAQTQETLAKSVGAITTAPPLNQWFDITAWNSATAKLKLS
jgi:ABC-type nitrate/sulfonate/bicarbonate transport system substrate-binding protein